MEKEKEDTGNIVLKSNLQVILEKSRDLIRKPTQQEIEYA